MSGIDGLIDKRDTFEIVRAQIAAILALEFATQVQYASQTGRDPEPWRVRVYEERANIWDTLVPDATDLSPIVNVWYDSSTFDPSKSNIVDRQMAAGVFNIDCYGFGVSAETAAGHDPGDMNAALAAQRAARLVRNILMADSYTYLDLRGTVWRRGFESISMYQPQQDNQHAQHAAGARLVFKVEFNEFSPQYAPQLLESISVRVHRKEDGEIVIAADYDYNVTT